MAYAIARLKKLKRSEIAPSASHTSRSRETPNASLRINNIRFIGSNNPVENLEDLVLAKINSQQQKRKIRTDGVYCVEMLLSASPSYFRPDCPTIAGYYQPEKLDQWLEATHQWLAQEYGSRIVRAELHLDEATPHIRAYFVPVDDNGQLRCNHFFDGREKIQKFQDSYYESMRLIGLERGLKGSLARHQDIKDFYRIVETGRDLEIDDLTIDQIKAKAADRDRAVRHKEQILATAHDQALRIELLEKRLEQVEADKLKLQQQALYLLDLPLEDVAWELGLDPGLAQPKKWLGHGHIIYIDGDNFQELSPIESTQIPPASKKGALDLVIHVNKCNIGQALGWINDRFGQTGVNRCAIAAALKQKADILQNEPKPKFTPPIPDQTNWQAVHDYLTLKQELPSNFVQGFHSLGLIYADKHKNAVFVMRDFHHEVKGAYVLATLGQNNTTTIAPGTKPRECWFHFQLGDEGLLREMGRLKASPSMDRPNTSSNRSLPISPDKVREPGTQVEKAVLCSSPIDTFSYAMFEYELTGTIPKQRTLYMAIDDPKSLPVQQLQHISQLKAAFNPTPVGELSASEIKKLLPQAKRLKPKTADWNQRLKALQTEQQMRSYREYEME